MRDLLNEEWNRLLMQIDDTDKRIKKSLKYSIMDGAFYSAMVGFGESFFPAFAVFLKANNIELGLLGSLPRTVGALVQLYSNKLLELFNSRKKLICSSALLQGLIYIPIGLVFFLGRFKVSSLIFFISLYHIFGMVLQPAWNSWMGDLVNEDKRGTYFGKRNKITGFTAFISFLLAGYLLHKVSAGIASEYRGFIIIFGVAMLSRIISFIYLTKKYEPTFKAIEETKNSFLHFLKEARFQNYGLFALYSSFMNFSVYLASPFFTPYMLYTLGLDYKTYTLVHAASLIIKFITMPIWGEILDKYGTKKILVVSGSLMPLVPLLWIFSQKTWYLILIQIYGGFIWAGFEIASFTFIFDTTASHQRAPYVAHLNVLNGIAIFFGGIVGGFIIRYTNFFSSQYFSVFILSSLLRYTASIFFLPKLKEARVVEEISYKKLLFKFITTMPTKGLVYNVITFRRNNKLENS